MSADAATPNRFPPKRLPEDLERELERWNPWWGGMPAPALPAFRRWPFARLRRLLDKGIAPATVLRGPRRVGKSVLLRQMIEQLLGEGIAPHRILYVPFDELPDLAALSSAVLAVARWFEEQRLGGSFNAAARRGEIAYLFFDEVQDLRAWAPQLKSLVDNSDLRALVTGSSSLRIAAGHDSLAGRLTTLDLGPLHLREIAELRSGQSIAPYWPVNGLEPLLNPDFWREGKVRAQAESAVRRQAFAAFSERGGYPFGHQHPDLPWTELADYLDETIIRRAIQHDLRMGPRGRQRDGALIEAIFRLCCRYSGQTPGANVFVPDIRSLLGRDVTWNRVLTYLQYLDDTMLLRLVPPLEMRLKRQTAGAKVCLADHALRAAWMQEVIPLDPEALATAPLLADLAGRIAEGVLGYYLGGVPNLDLAHYPARGEAPEVDFVLTIGTRRIPVEVKYRRKIDPFEDTRGLRFFLEKAAYNAPFGLLVTQEDNMVVPDPRIVAISLSEVLWLR